MRMVARIAVFFPLSVLALSLFVIALALETMRDARRVGDKSIDETPAELTPP